MKKLRELASRASKASVLSPLLALSIVSVVDAQSLFVRGDANTDGALDISDPVTILLHLFEDPSAGTCLEAMDANDDASVNVADPVSLLTSLFAGGPPPPPPFPNCGTDPTPGVLGCLTGADSCLQLQAGTLPLFPGAGFPVSDNPHYLLAVDLNADSSIDLVTGNNSLNNISVSMGTGQGTFSDPTSITLPGQISQVRALASADVNNDGNLDILAATQLAVHILLGDGVGNLSPSSTILSVSQPRVIKCGDIDGDGDQDIVVGGSGGVATHLNFGAFGFPFQGSVNTSPVSNCTDLELVDLNGDEILDIAVGSSGEGVSVLHGLGNGAFSPEYFYQTPVGLVDVTAADANADGLPDLLAFGSQIQVFLNQGATGYGLAWSENIATQLRDVAVSDFDGDLIPDIAFIDSPQNRVRVFSGEGDGSYVEEHVYSLGFSQNAKSIEVALLNPDSNADLIVTVTPTDTVRPLLGIGDGSFSAPLGVALASGGDKRLAVGNLLGDTAWDIAVATTNTEESEVFTGQGDGSFILEVFLDIVLTSSDSVRVVDINADGFIDVSILSGNFLNLFLRDSQGDFLPVQPIASVASASDHCYSDFDGDNLLDCAVLGASTAGVSLHFGSGPASFSPAVFQPLSTSPTRVEAGDVDNDGDNDLILLFQGTHEIRVLLNDGFGGFPFEGPFGTSSSPLDLTVIDVDSDSALDVVTACTDDQIGLHLGVGNGVLLPPLTYETIPDPNTIRVVDVNSDGLLDLVMCSEVTSTIGVMLGDGVGFSDPVEYRTSGNPTDIAIFDANGDGLLDIVAVGTSTVLDVFLNQSQLGVSPQP